MNTCGRPPRLIVATLLVARIASPAIAADKAGIATGPKAESRGTAAIHSDATLDLNAATAAELEALPGVGKATAKKISAPAALPGAPA